MAYKCRICGTNDVEHVGDVCELCAIGQDPYAAAMQNNNVTPEVSKQGLFQPQTSSDTGNYIPRRGKNRRVLLNGGASVANVDPYGNSIFSQDESSIHVYQAGQVPVSQQVTNQPITISTGNTNATGSVIGVNKNKPLTSGITKNISVDVQKKSALRKLFRTLFKGIPYRFLRKPRSKAYMDALHKLDAGGHVHNQNKVNEIINTIKSEFPEIELNGILLGYVAICYLGKPYEVHTLDITGGIIEHYKAGSSISRLTDIINQNEHAKYFDMSDIFVNSDDEKGRIVLSGVMDADSRYILYDLIKIDDNYVYRMLSVKPKYRTEEERIQYVYVTENEYRMCGFAGSSQAARSYEEFLESNP